MSRTWFQSLLLSLMLLSLPAKAQTFEDGYQSYVRNQFPVAELQFKNALKKTNADEEKAFILKFIGICQYMRGDKRGAANSFTQSVQLDRSVQIDSEEVLDPTVVSYFNAIKSRVPPEAKKSPKAVEASPAPQQQPKQIQQAPKRKLTKKKRKNSSMALAAEMKSLEDKPNKIGIMHFLPLGLPQVANGSYILASGFAGLQLYSLYSMYDAQKVAKERSSLNVVVRDSEGLTEEQRQSFYKENNAYVDELKKQKNLAIAGFGALWVISVAEGIINAKSSGHRSADDRPIPPARSLSPILQANRHGGGFGLSFQTQLN